MTPAVVVDIGNSRMKWGRVAGGRISESTSFALDDEAGWTRKLAGWRRDNHPWLIAGVVPKAVGRFSAWLEGNVSNVVVLDNARFLGAASGFRTRVQEPDQIGIDRLLNSYAAWRLATAAESKPMAAVAISVGTATTIDFVESDGTHVGGAILPGPRLLAKSLAEETAKLPMVDAGRFKPTLLVGRNTTEAIQLGITRATAHAADGLIGDWADAGQLYSVYITGGDGDLFRDFSFAGSWSEVVREPLLALEGLRLVAESLP